MEAFFETRCKTKTSAKQHLNVIKNISKKLDFNNEQEFISKFNEVKKLIRYLFCYNKTKIFNNY